MKLSDFDFRPLNEDEQRLNTPKVITCNESKKQVTVSQSVASKQVDRVFTFDKAWLSIPSCL